MAEITLGDMIQEVRREIEMRRAVYARQVEMRKMSRSTADHRIKLMEEIERTLQGVLDI
jgi:hypothetical protein